MAKSPYYPKKGALNWKEKKYIKKLTPLLDQKMRDPNFAANFKPFLDQSELEKAHELYFSDDATIISETKHETPSNMSTETTNSTPADNVTTEPVTTKSIPDPFNAEEPIIRDYVLKENSFDSGHTATPSENQAQPTQFFNEPTSFDEAFTIPETTQDHQKVNDANNPNSGQKQTSQGTEKKQQPANPQFDELSHADKKKQTKKFAKYITKFVCFALEKGYVWFATKDISEARMIEYELKDEIDVNLMLSLDAGTQVTVKDFFKKMCSDAKEQAKILEDEQNDLSDALADVLMEKGIAPTPMQTLMITAAQIVGQKLVSLIMIKQQTNDILKQLKDMKKSAKDEEEELLNEIAKEEEKQTAKKAESALGSNDNTEIPYAEVIQ